MDSLDYILENREYISKLGIALDTNNVAAKKQVFEVLSALCEYNADGYARAIETLEFYQKHKKERYRLKIVINELEKVTDVEYRIAVLQFINCIIISSASLEERIHIRNEFIGLKVLPLLSELRKAAQGVSDIIEQLDLFDERRECDEEQSLQGGSNGINLNSHLDVFYAILRQVADTPQEVPFLSILQHLLRIDPKEPVSDAIWDITEKLVHRATLVENHEDSERLLRCSLQKKFTCSHCRSNDATSPNRRISSAPNTTTTATTAMSNNNNNSTTTSTPPPPPPPIPPVQSCVAPPPPPPPLKKDSFVPLPPSVPDAPPVPNACGIKATALAGIQDTPKILLPQQDTPEPQTKMKTLNWCMIPPHIVIGKENIWSKVASDHGQSALADIDWPEIERLFCVPTTIATGPPKRNGGDVTDNKPKVTEIQLLAGKRSLKVNIFLKQFRTCNNDIIQLVRNGAHSQIGAEKSRGLLQILPEKEEMNLLKSFNGDYARLGSAEKFLLQLMEVSNFKLRIESMLLQQEFPANIEYLEPCITAVLYAGEELMSSKTLQDVLYIVVMAGNFLNWGGYAGNAAGVKLASLQKLTDIRANKPDMNLLHFVAMQAEKRQVDILKFTENITMLENAAKTTPEQITNEITALDARIRNIKQEVELPSTDADIKEQMQGFLETAEREIAILQAGMKEVEAMRLKLSDFFCENPRTFRLEECFKIFQNFCSKFSQAVKENEKRRHTEAQRRERKRQREEQLARRAKQINTDAEQQQLSLDSSFADLHASPAPLRRRKGSIHATFGDKSPDITPNGSFRESKLVAGRDELLEYLRNSSGHEHISRDRKAYGSLDRSWARNARSGSASRRRPELLSFEFERERANSPAPILIITPEERSCPGVAISPAGTLSGHEDSKPRISREWRQKIETWLQSNENDEKQNDEYKRKRRLVQQNRRSLENDSESERKLDTLPEEKSVPTTPLPTIVNLGHHYQQQPHHQSRDPSTTATTNHIDHYQRVYPDWKSPANTVSDLSSPPQTTAGELRDLRRHRSAEHSELNGKTLIAIDEEDRRKQLIQELAGPQNTEHLKVYIRRSVTHYNEQLPEDEKKHCHMVRGATTETAETIEPQSASKIKPHNDRHASGKEIDADNIETPPVTRRVFAGPNTTTVTVNNNIAKELSPTSGTCGAAVKHKQTENDNDDVKPDKFDRNASIRRTLRYKSAKDVERSQELIAGATADNIVVMPVSGVHEESQQLVSPPLAAAAASATTTTLTEEHLTPRMPIPMKTITKLEKVGRHLSTINQEDVQKAKEKLRSPLDAPERLWSLPRDMVRGQSQTELPQVAGNGNSNTHKQRTCSSIKLSHHELNDEGFEETQSLVSDTPSHSKDSTNSSCNEATSELSKQAAQTLTTKCTATKHSPIKAVSPSATSKIAERLQITKLRLALPQKTQHQPRRTPSAGGGVGNALDRPRLQRLGNVSYPGEHISLVSTAVAAQRRSNSMRRPTHDATVPPPSTKSRRSGDVERSSSRNSLRSSRSSINSATSTKTVVRRLANVVNVGGGVKTTPLHTVSADSSPTKRPLAAQNAPSHTRAQMAMRYRGGIGGANGGGIPASRSSSSGSSVSHNVVSMRRIPVVHNRPASTDAIRSGAADVCSLGSTSFKENQQHTATGTRTSATRNGVLATKAHSVSQPQQQTIQTGSFRTSGFMRPTASSATKRNK